MELSKCEELFEFLLDGRFEVPDGKPKKTYAFNLKQRAAHFDIAERDTPAAHLVYVGKGGETARRVVREGETERVIRHVHEKIGHLREKNTRDRVKKDFYWTGIEKHVKAVLAKCDRCQRNAPLGGVPTELHPVDPNRGVFVQWGMDLTKMPKSHDGFEYISVAVCHGSKYKVAEPLRDKKADTIVNFFNRLCCKHGFPEVLITDQGTEFCNVKMDKFCQNNGIKHRKTSAYHPEANGLTENANKHIKGGLRKLTPSDDRKSWPDYLPNVLFGLNTIVPRATKVSPFSLVHGGLEARIGAATVLYGLPSDDEADDGADSEGEWLEARMEQMKAATEARINQARLNIKEEQARYKQYFDLQHNPNKEYNKGDLVWLENSRKGTRKGGAMEQNWQGPYTIHLVTKNNTLKLRNAAGELVTKKGVNPRRLRHALPTNAPNDTERWLQFVPPTAQWMVERAAAIGVAEITLPFYLPPMLFPASAPPPPEQIVAVKGDGNCLFRCFSYALTGDADFHAEVRAAIVAHIQENEEQWLPLLDARFKSVADYLDSGVGRPGSARAHWGTDLEMRAFASAFNCRVGVWSRGSTWLLYEPLFLLPDDVPTVLIRSQNDHFDVVLSP